MIRDRFLLPVVALLLNASILSTALANDCERPLTVVRNWPAALRLPFGAREFDPSLLVRERAYYQEALKGGADKTFVPAIRPESKIALMMEALVQIFEGDITFRKDAQTLSEQIFAEIKLTSGPMTQLEARDVAAALMKVADIKDGKKPFIHLLFDSPMSVSHRRVERDFLRSEDFKELVTDLTDVGHLKKAGLIKAARWVFDDYSHWYVLTRAAVTNTLLVLVGLPPVDLRQLDLTDYVRDQGRVSDLLEEGRLQDAYAMSESMLGRVAVAQAALTGAKRIARTILLTGAVYLSVQWFPFVVQEARDHATGANQVDPMGYRTSVSQGSIEDQVQDWIENRPSPPTEAQISGKRAALEAEARRGLLRRRP